MVEVDKIQGRAMINIKNMLGKDELKVEMFIELLLRRTTMGTAMEILKEMGEE